MGLQEGKVTFFGFSTSDVAPHPGGWDTFDTRLLIEELSNIEFLRSSIKSDNRFRDNALLSQLCSCKSTILCRMDKLKCLLTAKENAYSAQSPLQNSSQTLKCRGQIEYTALHRTQQTVPHILLS